MIFGMSLEMGLTFLVLAVTILLFVTEILRVDVVAVLVILILAWTGLVSPAQALSGLASNAVVSMAAIMILGRGMERAGVVHKISRAVLRIAGSDERRLIGITSWVVGLISSFMQNVGSVALFLPAVLRISKSTRTPASRV